ncbi:MAG: hypothetical protein K2K63_14295 [Acetatifactor sp.]|nr:hypothetical protein [Acetatifactor sp.]
MREGGRKLNMVMTYPIRWSMCHIMEDYIQNFYDVIGAENFAQDFVYSYDESRRELRMEGRKGFHVEWLHYIGASTKGENSAHYMAGKFGEGFKIASLCAYRDYKVSVHMESRDWALNVLKMPGKIDGQSIEFLGYDIKKRVYEDNSMLLLGNIALEAYQDFLEAIQRFFYPENPLFGECIANTRDYAVYRMKSSGISGGQRIMGKVFASMQERAEIRGIPLIFCNHSYEPDKEDDRDRERFHFHDIESAVTEIVVRLEGEALRKVFMEFQPYWRRDGRSAVTGQDWNRLIRKMVWQIRDDHTVRQKVYDCLKDHYIADIDACVIKWDKNKYKTATAWFRMSRFYGVYKLLPYYFSDLGINTIYDLCEKYDGFHVIYEPDELQRSRIQILEKMARDIFSDMIYYEKLPECRVIVNEGTPNEGFVRVNDTENPQCNEMGLKVVNDITEVNLRKALFCKDSFPETMIIYMHELLHQFGGDASRQFRTAILAMDYRIMQNFGKLEEYECMWRKIE